MGLSASIRTTVRNMITNLPGSTATLYSYSSATKSSNSEGDVTVSSWGTGTSIKLVSSNHYKLRRIMGVQGEENNQGDRVVFVRDDVTVNERDKITIGTDDYLVREIKQIDPLENTVLAQRLVLTVDVKY